MAYEEGSKEKRVTKVFHISNMETRHVSIS